jgi:nucleotide-binding universal stress UspA family protein
MPVTGPIVVATDFSTRSDRALRRATMIARKFGTGLALVHVVDDDQPRHMVADQIESSRRILDETVDTIAQMDGVSAEATVFAGDVFAGILQAAEKRAAGLIIVGPHRRQLRDVFMGTTAERTIAHSRYPVLLAAGVPSAPYDRALVALDLNDVSRAAALEFQRLDLVDRAEIVAMHAFDAPAQRMMHRAMVGPETIDHYVAGEQADAQAAFNETLSEVGLGGTRKLMVPVDGSPARRILECAREENASLIVVGTSQRAGIRRFMLGSVAETILGDTDRDVLVVPIAVRAPHSDRHSDGP